MVKTLVTVLLCLSVLLLSVVIVYVVFRIIQRRIIGRRRVIISPMAVLACMLGSIWCLRYAVGYFGLHYPELSCVAADSSLASLTWFEEILNSLVHALQTFSMDEDYTAYIISSKAMVRELYGAGEAMQSLLGGYASVLNLLAPVAGGAVVLEIIASFFPRFKLFCARIAVWRDKFYFNELNEGSLALAKSYMNNKYAPFRSPVIIFADVYSNDDEKNSELIAEAKLIGAICLKDDLSHIRLNKSARKKFFLIDSSEDDSLKSLTAITDPENVCIKGAEIYLFVNSDAYVQVERSIRNKLTDAWGLDKQEIASQDDNSAGDLPVIIPVRCYRNLVSNMLCDIPLYEPLIGKPRDSGKVDLTVTILGTGSIGTEMFLSTYWFGQILNCDLKINILSEESEEAFWNKIDYVNPEIRHTTIRNDPILRINKKGDMADVYCDVRYLQCDVKSSKFIECLNPHGNSANSVVDTDYFFVCLGSDEDNISLANTIKNYVGQYHLSPEYAQKRQARKDSAGPDTVITYVVYDTALSSLLNEEKQFKSDCKNVDIYMRAVGSMDKVYSVENVTMSGYSILANEIHSAYMSMQNDDFIADNRKRSRKPTDEYEYWANLARTMHRRYKMFSAGMIDFSIEDSDYRSKMEKARKSYQQLATSDRTGENAELLDELAWLEHRRWCAFTRVKGYRHTDDFAAYYESSGDHKQMELKLHPCLVECDHSGLRATFKNDNGNIIKESDARDLDLLDALVYDIYDESVRIDPNRPVMKRFKYYDYPAEDKILENIGKE
ncbi:MAG: hypothetical protein LUH18_07310 [Oscillospiraceae bacterium]|nr:hypothetical protein [Oscillospiraceae bacterium]